MSYGKVSNLTALFYQKYKVIKAEFMTMTNASARRDEKDEIRRIADKVARYWHSAGELSLGLSFIDEKVTERYHQDVLPWLADQVTGEIAARDLLDRLKNADNSDTLDTYHFALWYCDKFLRHAIDGREVFADLPGAWFSVKTGPVTAEIRKAIEDILRAMDAYRESFALECILQLSLLMRLGLDELRLAKWAEIDLEASEWRIPGERTPSRDPYVVPLSANAVGLLHDLQPLTGDRLYVFPNIRANARGAGPMGEAILNGCLQRLGYSSDEMAVADFRALASMALSELGFKLDVENLAERRALTERWEDYVFDLADLYDRAEDGKATPKVIHLTAHKFTHA